MDDELTYSLDQLATLAELPRRTVRYYIQIGLIDRPNGVGKGAWYTAHHLEQLLLVRKWQLAGLSLERISELVRAPSTDALPPAPRRAGTVEVWSHVVLAEGVELTVEPSRAGLSPEQLRALCRAVAEAYDQIKAHNNNERNDTP
jgi:DNA-binding transcriptional MerR regulator